MTAYAKMCPAKQSPTKNKLNTIVQKCYSRVFPYNYFFVITRNNFVQDPFLEHLSLETLWPETFWPETFWHMLHFWRLMAGKFLAGDFFTRIPIIACMNMPISHKTYVHAITKSFAGYKKKRLNIHVILPLTFPMAVYAGIAHTQSNSMLTSHWYLTP